MDPTTSQYSTAVSAAHHFGASLPFTGFDAMALLLVAALLIGLGFALKAVQD